MTPLVRHLATYAVYHRDRRNLATHMLGIPLIMLAVAVLTSRAGLMVDGVQVTSAMLLSLLAALFYLRLDLRLGLLMAALLALTNWFGLEIAALPRATWLAIGLGGFVAGWSLQFVGHIYEGRKPAFLDDLTGLVIGPLFIVAEIVVLLGLRPELKDALITSERRHPR